MNKVSVFIISLNEERQLEGCLETVKWADEIVIVDSFSTDKTINIAKKYGCKIYKKKFNGFGPTKNFALSKTKNNWVLNIDADERITKGLAEEIIETLKNPLYAGYYFPRKSYIGKKWLKYSGQYPSYQLRLFRKDCGGFENVVTHERVKINGNVGCMKNDLIHYNYENWSAFIRKNDRFTEMEARDILKKKHVWIHPPGKVKQFFSEVLNAKRNGSTLTNSLRIGKNVFADYEIRILIPFRPFMAFIRRYIFQQGFRDGMYGLFWCTFTAIHMFMKYVKYYELKHNLGGFDFEKKI